MKRPSNRRDPKTANWMIANGIEIEIENEIESGDDDENANTIENAIENAIWSAKWIEIVLWIGFLA